MTINCLICKKYTGLSTSHDDDGCPLAESVLCLRCHGRGHLTSTCTYGVLPQWETPLHLEDLIPVETRARFGITTQTAITLTAKRGSKKARHERRSDLHEVVLKDDYTELRDFAKRYNITVDKKTKPDGDEILAAIKTWTVSRGMRLCIMKNAAVAAKTD